jgi:hypothetical protein
VTADALIFSRRAAAAREFSLATTEKKRRSSLLSIKLQLNPEVYGAAIAQCPNVVFLGALVLLVRRKASQDLEVRRDGVHE